VAPIGLAVDPYRLLARLNDEGTGDAYLAERIGIGGFTKRVEIRRVDDARRHDAGYLEAVALEAEQGASLSHAGVAQVLDLGMNGGTCFVVTEHVTGRTLEEVLQVTENLPWRIAAHIANEVAGTLSYAHVKRRPNGKLLRLAHGRLAPARIVLSPGGDVKVTGFGVSWAYASPQAYRSPEHGRREPVDGRADVFALGAMLRHCLPRADVPSALRCLVDRAMQAYPEQRPTAPEVQQELTRILHASERPVTPRELAAQTTDLVDARFAAFGAIERVLHDLDSAPLRTPIDAWKRLDLYERLGRLCVEAELGERGAHHMIRALDLADGLGRDDCAALFCALRGELLMQADRIAESRDWLERAAALRA